MFKELQKLFQRKGLVEQALEESYQMLEIDWEMFNAAKKSLRESETADVDIDVDETDIQINKFERNVRKKVLTHLAVHDASDLNISLILINIINDIERIGDYTKNIVTLAQNHPGKLQISIEDWEEDLQHIEETIDRNFGVLIDALKNFDTDKANQLLDELWKIKKTCSRYVAATIANDLEIKTSDAVAIALYMRYLKWIASHLMNIATSIVNPFHKIGYRTKKVVEEVS